MRKSKKDIDRPKEEMFKMGWSCQSEKKVVNDAISGFPGEWSIKRKIVELSKRYLELVAEGSTAKSLIRNRLFQGYVKSLREIDDHRQADIIETIAFLLTNDISEIAPDLFANHYGFFFNQYIEDNKRLEVLNEVRLLEEKINNSKPVTGRIEHKSVILPGLKGVIDKMRD